MRYINHIALLGSLILVRNPTWISPPMPRVEIDVAPQNEASEGKVYQTLEIQQYHYTPEEIAQLKDDPEKLLNYRKRIEYGINAGFAMFYKDSDASRLAEKYMRGEMTRRLGNDPKLVERLIPKWAPGCR
jgi:hypothetical protein